MFTAWCSTRGVDPAGASSLDVAAYVGHLVASDRKTSTVGRAIAGVTAAYQAAGREANPARAEVVRRTMAGMRRTVGVARRQARPVTPGGAGPHGAALPDTRAGRRDRALLLVGFAAALRPS